MRTLPRPTPRPHHLLLPSLPAVARVRLRPCRKIIRSHQRIAVVLGVRVQRKRIVVVLCPVPFCFVFGRLVARRACMPHPARTQYSARAGGSSRDDREPLRTTRQQPLGRGQSCRVQCSTCAPHESLRR
ncbi:hypothetical protein L1887_49725 [Cichorium endivia]|nr:hypothetical protein L1887_49725 [Cichorium endivia]